MAKQRGTRKRNAKKPGTTKKRKGPRRGTPVKVTTRKHKSRRGTKPKAAAVATHIVRMGAAAPASARFRTVQVRNVPADEVDDLIAEESTKPEFVSAQPHEEADGEFTVIFVYRDT